jgi:hypothetical protein
MVTTSSSRPLRYRLKCAKHCRIYALHFFWLLKQSASDFYAATLSDLDVAKPQTVLVELV